MTVAKKPIPLTEWFLYDDDFGVYVGNRDDTLSAHVVRDSLVVDYDESHPPNCIRIPLQALRALGI